MVVMSAAWVSKPYSLSSILFNSMYDNVPSAKFLQGENALRDVAHACQAEGDAGSETCSSSGVPLSYVILRSGALAADGDAASQEEGAVHLSQTDSFSFKESGPKLSHSQLAHAAVEALKVQGKYTVEVSGSGNGKTATSSYQGLSQDDDVNFNRYYSMNRTTTVSAQYIEQMHAKAVADFYNVIFTLLVGTVLLVGLLGVTRGLALSMTLYLLTTILWMTFLSNLTLVEAVSSSSSNVRGVRSITQQVHKLDVVTLDNAHVRALQGWLPPVTDGKAEEDNQAAEKEDNKNKNKDKNEEDDDDDGDEVDDGDENDNDTDAEEGNAAVEESDTEDNEDGASGNAEDEVTDITSTNAPTETATIRDDASEELLGNDAGKQTISPTQESFTAQLEEAVSAAEDVDDTATVTETPPSVVPADENVPESSSSGAQPHYVTLEPFYLKVTMSGESYEEGFMEVLVDYLEYYMSTGFEAFESISYGVSTFSQTSEIPPAAARNEGASSELITNSTVHVHLLTAIFDGSPGAPDAVILDYMEMMLENPVMLQEYIDSQTETEATIYGIEFEVEEASDLTNGQESQAQAEVEKDESSGTNVSLIAGITAGCFVAVVWMVYLYGIQRRHHIQYHS